MLTFADQIPDQRFTAGTDIGRLVLPAAGDGSGPYRYSIQPALPEGLHFDEGARTLYGVPADTMSSAVFMYEVMDGALNTGRMAFSIAVVLGTDVLFTFQGNCPNPFREVTRLEFSLSKRAEVGVEVYDLLGKRILKQPPSVYFYRVLVGGQQVVHTGQMTVVR